jgi:transcriptional regulator with XRE-family HTH domain
MVEILALGQRIRHVRQAAGLTLEELSARVGVTPSQLSLVETGKREAKIGLLSQLARAFDVEVAELLDESPPTERARLERDWAKAQHSTLHASLGLPEIKASKSLSDDHLSLLLGLHEELVRRETRAIATPEEARRANTELRLRMRERNNYREDLEDLAENLVRSVGHQAMGALTHREVAQMAQKIGLEIVHVGDLPRPPVDEAPGSHHV